MAERCMVCGQPLPAGVSEVEMHRRLDKFSAAAAKDAAADVRRELDRRYRIEIAEQAAAIRKRAVADAQATSRRERALMQRRLDAGESASRRAIEKAVNEASASSRNQME